MRHYHNSVDEEEPEPEEVKEKIWAAVVHLERVKALRERRIAPQLMSPTPYADALRALPRKCAQVETSLEERPHCFLLTPRDDDVMMFDMYEHAHTLREFVRTVYDKLFGSIMFNGPLPGWATRTSTTPMKTRRRTSATTPCPATTTPRCRGRTARCGSSAALRT